MDESPPLSADELDRSDALLAAWLGRQLAQNPVLASGDRYPDGGPTERCWHLRGRGEEKDSFTLRFTLRQRMLHYETYMMPGPEENHARFFEYLLAQNRQLVGVSF